MLGWAVAFLVAALVAAAFGFGGLAGPWAIPARILFVAFLVLFVAMLALRALQGRPPR